MESRSLQDKVVVVTGASSGFGKGAARRLAQEGANVVLSARREELLDELVNECEFAGGRALAVPADVGRLAEVEGLMQKTLEQFGHVDIWVNNAGIGALGRFDVVPLSDHLKVIETNLLGTLYGSHLALQEFQRQHFGILINIASILGKIPAPYYGSYVASKHGIVGLSAALRQELAKNKIDTIHVCTVLPMSHDTPFFDHAANYTAHEAVPLPPLNDPEKVVDVIVELALNPEDEVVVGSGGRMMLAAHQWVPGLIESYMAN
jgi:short-subunit dehydrogenase